MRYKLWRIREYSKKFFKRLGWEDIQLLGECSKKAHKKTFK